MPILPIFPFFSSKDKPDEAGISSSETIENPMEGFMILKNKKTVIIMLKNL
jgi:hypothetical protein